MNEALDSGWWRKFCRYWGRRCRVWVILGDASVPSFRRRPESILTLFFPCPAPRKPTHIRVSSIDVPVDRSLSFACPKESNQRKGHPRGRGRRASMPDDFASRLRGSATARPCAGAELAAILAAIAARLFLHLLAATWRGPGGKQSAAVPAAEAFDSPLLILGPSVKRRRSAGQGRVPRTRCAPGMARIWRQGRSPAAKPRPTAANRRVAPALHRGCISLVTFFVQAKKVTRPPGRLTKPNSDERSASAKRKSKWIPASAGMTEGRTFAG